MIRSISLLGLVALLPLAGCGADSPSETPASGLAAPTWEMTGPGGRFSLEDAAGRAVVLQFASSSPEAWEALAAAHADLEAAGALVVGAVTEGSAAGLGLPFAMVKDPEGVIAATYGYTGRPLVVVIDADGRLRSRAESVETIDQFFDLAAGALLEADDLDAPLSPTAQTMEPTMLASGDVADMVREGAALFDLRPEVDRTLEGAIPYAFVCPPEALDEDVLPVNALMPVILAGPGARRLAEHVVSLGYQAVYFVDEASALADPEAEAFEPADELPPSRLPGQRRAIG